ncbi:MAG: dTDP-4-amino-4,6-dideoxyglucose formyltransferase [Hoylesella enoeca]|uniref:dTDP-4-amino-4,6-dideoxyglucose formyltransferase n=1 Tax=Hoylesella enoeca TaxID=76123 RepID=UPI003F9EC36C
MKIFIITDNRFIYDNFIKIIRDSKYKRFKFDFYCSQVKGGSPLEKIIPTINLKQCDEKQYCDYDLFVSLHCKQIFPDKIVNNFRCVNVHPGFNPYNRGWYPQAFSIINKLPVGVTIHEMDSLLDHGPIIVQKEVAIESWETSFDVYTKIQKMEIKLLKEFLPIILNGDYKTTVPYTDGNINLKADFDKLCEIDLEERLTWREAIDRLRALSFAGYKNAFFYEENGRRIFVDISLTC